ncbi:Uncharacterized protein FWK35_00023990 [Aphis craccivora]|uniref:Uncharacterized protein n=1 Tax=Aphis craccivora TaxID=307492 RepID=A0A6G0YGC1_APHCR|nr:Uncharacterized protein FWK35_00023990 [Aphis craccivora]
MILVVHGARVLAMVIGCIDLFDNSVETVFVVSGVHDHAGGSVGFHETVRSFDVTVTVTLFVLAFDVMRVKIFHIMHARNDRRHNCYTRWVSMQWPNARTKHYACLRINLISLDYFTIYTDDYWNIFLDMDQVTSTH